MLSLFILIIPLKFRLSCEIEKAKEILAIDEERRLRGIRNGAKNKKGVGF